jgi:hypothetical protein
MALDLELWPSPSTLRPPPLLLLPPLHIALLLRTHTTGDSTPDLPTPLYDDAWEIHGSHKHIAFRFCFSFLLATLFLFSLFSLFEFASSNQRITLQNWDKLKKRKKKNNMKLSLFIFIDFVFVLIIRFSGKCSNRDQMWARVMCLSWV